MTNPPPGSRPSFHDGGVNVGSFLNWHVAAPTANFGPAATMASAISTELKDANGTK
jgi:hypothetical protein